MKNACAVPSYVPSNLTLQALGNEGRNTSGDLGFFIYVALPLPGRKLPQYHADERQPKARILTNGPLNISDLLLTGKAIERGFPLRPVMLPQRLNTAIQQLQYRPDGLILELFGSADSRGFGLDLRPDGFGAFVGIHWVR